MSSLDFNITFHNGNATYLCGDTISGNVNIALTNESRMHGIQIVFLGQAAVLWTEEINNRSSVVLKKYKHREVYIDRSVYLVGGPSDDVVLPIGTYEFPFRYFLPSNIPSSFEGDNGSVRYFVRGIIYWAADKNSECKRAFTVIHPLDLNTIPDIQEPSRLIEETLLCFWCCASRSSALIVNLPIQGFVPGQEIKALIEFDNGSGNVVTLKCKLIQRVTYTASCGLTKENTKLIGEELLGSAESRSSFTKLSKLKIPSLAASLVCHCECISISYIFQVTAQLPRKELEVNTPIIIGNIPLSTQFDQIMRSDTHSPSDPMQPGYPVSSGFSQYSQIPPPSYEECTFRSRDVRENNNSETGSLEFSPRYPIFHFK